MLKSTLVLASLIALAASFAAGNLQGRKAERAAWELVDARQARDAAQLMAESEAKARAAALANAELNDQIERNSLDATAKLTAVYNTNALLLASLDGLYDRAGSGICRPDQLPGPAPPAAQPATAAAGGCRLSGETSRALLDLAALADRTAIYAQACHAWIAGVGAQNVR